MLFEISSLLKMGKISINWLPGLQDMQSKLTGAHVPKLSWKKEETPGVSEHDTHNYKHLYQYW